MVLVIHVIAAVLSLIVATVTAIAPARNRLKLATGLVAVAVVSGTFIIFSSSVNILPTCISGLVYLAVVCGELVYARYKLAQQLAD